MQNPVLHHPACPTPQGIANCPIFRFPDAMIVVACGPCGLESKIPVSGLMSARGEMTVSAVLDGITCATCGSSPQTAYLEEKSLSGHGTFCWSTGQAP